MVKLARCDYAGLCLLIAVVLLSRLPFLSAGYGLHADSWRVANVARHIAQTGDYEVSRFPGYPVQEYVCSLIWKGGPLALNGASAFFSTAAVLFFALILREMQCKDWFPASLALAFAPIFYINSVTSKDYAWALAFTLAAWFAILKDRQLVAGICLGLAIGSRITSGVASLPLLLVIAGMNRPNPPMRKFLMFAMASACTATIAYLPVVLKYGSGFFNTYPQQSPDWLTFATRGTLQVWGLGGMAGLLIALTCIAWKKFRKESFASFPCPPFHVFAWAAAVWCYAVIYLSLPHEAGYLIPMIPFAILLLARFCPRRVFQVFCILVIAGAFFGIDEHGINTGDVVSDHKQRLATSQGIDNYVAFTRAMPGKNTFVVGSWEPEITNRYPASTHPSADYVYLLTPQDVLHCIKTGSTIYCTQLMRQFNYRVYQVDLMRYGARDIEAIHERKMKALAQPASR